MANPQPTDSHLRLAVSIHLELMLRDFSKRQYKTVLGILRISWACGKKYAVIPQYTKYFKACGIHKSDIKKELVFLVKNKVIFWEQTTNIFEFNKNFDEWLIPYHPEADKGTIQEIISINLKSWQNTNRVCEIQTEFVKNTNGVGEKSELDEAENIDTEQETAPTITSIITNYYNPSSSSEDLQQKEIFNILKNIKNYSFDLKKDSEMLKKLAEKYSDLDLHEAINEWSIYKLDNPLTDKCSPRSQINTWLKKGVEFGKYKKYSIQAETSQEDVALTQKIVKFESPEEALRRMQTS